MSENKATNTRTKKPIRSFVSGLAIGGAVIGAAYLYADPNGMSNVVGESFTESARLVEDENSEVMTRDGMVDVSRYKSVLEWAQSAVEAKPTAARDELLEVINISMEDGILSNGEYKKISAADTAYKKHKLDVYHYILMMGDNRDTVAGKAFVKVAREASADGKITDDEFKKIELAHAEYQKSIKVADINKTLKEI